MKPRILLLDEPHPKARAIMEEVAELGNVASNYSMSSCDIVYTQLTPVITWKPVFCPCTSVEHIKAPNIIHLNDHWKANEGREVTSTAEHTWSLILQLAKLNRMQLREKTIGIIGYGRIGQQVEKYAEAFGMRVMLYDRYKRNLKNSQLQSTLLVNSDVISIHIPLNSETVNSICGEFSIMKPGTLLVNTSRAQIVNEPALMDALDNGTLGGYADDFFHEHESGRLKVMSKYGNKVILTDHIAGNCVEAREATDIYVANKIKEYIEGGCI